MSNKQNNTMEKEKEYVYECLSPAYRDFKCGEIYEDIKTEYGYISTLWRLYDGDWKRIEKK